MFWFTDILTALRKKLGLRIILRLHFICYNLGKIKNSFIIPHSVKPNTETLHYNVPIQHEEKSFYYKFDPKLGYQSTIF